MATKVFGGLFSAAVIAAALAMSGCASDDMKSMNNSMDKKPMMHDSMDKPMMDDSKKEMKDDMEMKKDMDNSM